MSDSSAGSSTTKSTTPKTDNRGEFVGEGGDQLPEASHQPHLESSNLVVDDDKPNHNGSMAQVVPVDPANGAVPTNMQKDTVMGDSQQGHRWSNGRRPSRSSRSSRHRRTHSDDIYSMSSNPPPPLPHGYYAGAPVPYHMMLAKHESFDNGGQVAAPPPPRRHGGGHHRANSLPQAPSGIPTPNNMMVYPAPGYSPSGNPLVPMLPQGHETGPLLPYTGASPGGSHRKRKSQAASRRASAPVMMMAPPPPPPQPGHPAMYGSFEDYTSELNAPVPPPPPQSSSTYGDKFSPREELMSLTGASPRTTRTPPGSPSVMRKSGIQTPPQHPRTPRRSPPSSSLRTPGSGGGGYRGVEDPRVSFSPHTPIIQQRDGYSSSGRSPYLSAGGADPNDGFNLNDVQRGRKHRSPHSLRKMNMRQKSAQLFMEDTKGVRQPVAFRDVLFGVLFVMHLAGIIYLGRRYSRDAIMVNATHGELAINVWYRNVILIAALSGAFAVGVSTLTLILMTVIVKRLIQVSLILTIALSFAWGTIGIGVSPKNVVPITGIIALALSVGYAFIVWDRIPFAAANLMAGLHGVRKNAGTVLVAFCFQFLALVWSIYFTFVVIGVYDALLNGDLVLSKHATVFVYTMLFISFFWTYSVLYHVVQVTVAGTIGTWWFKPDSESSFCSPCVTQTFLQAISFSFGSVCFGSLLVEPVRLMRQLSAFVRPAQDEYAHFGLLECFSWIQQCITDCVDNLAAYFTPYAFTYIGLYGYGLLEAGHDATDLFKKRDWMPIVSDDLIPNVLLMVSLVIGGVTGCFAVSIQQLDRLDISTLESPTVFAFVIGAFTGLVVTHVLFGLISSSVNAVLVLFAGSPVPFEENHPELSQELRSAWREVWPGCMDVVDIRVAQIHHDQQQQQQHDHNGTSPGASSIPIV